MTDTPVTSLLMIVGRAFYALHEAVDEYRQWGVSKRLPLTTVPEGLVPLKSKIFVAHAEAIVRVNNPDATLHDLAYRLYEMDLLDEMAWHELLDTTTPYWRGLELHAEDFVPASMLTITYALSRASGARKGTLQAEFDLEYCMGIFGFAPLDSLQYVLAPGETALPAEMQHLEGVVQPVHIVYAPGGEDNDLVEDAEEE